MNINKKMRKQIKTKKLKKSMHEIRQLIDENQQKIRQIFEDIEQDT